ncbi:malonyl-ACP O-methyltransferase BioC [Alcanivorax hongdengensis]|uniref:malonyl-ACP O-methyltransferase BioC n=1 Tax=Alcanivorax hongdengensis TaxID=519051 RepID=UPI00058D5CB3|nr:malonyl-ACP O-methyltransferase BioC [Alcanivorax hongdengensis]
MTSIVNTDWLAEPVVRYPDKSAVNEHFSRAARSYDAHAILQLAVGRALVQRLPGELPVPTALDLGCATAPFARAQQQALPQVQWQAVDLSRVMLAEAAERGRLNDHYRPLCADAETLPLADASQGLVFSCFALQWCDPQRVMTEIHRVLAPGGRLLLALPLAGSLRELRDSWQAVNGRPHVNRLPALADWQAATQQAGFADAQLQQQVMVESYHSVKQIARRLKATGADHVSGATGLTGKNAWLAMVKEYESKRTEQGLPLTWNVLFLDAEKIG